MGNAGLKTRSLNRLLLGAGLALALATPPALAADKGAPPTRTDAVTDTYHGVTVPDPYRWLEDGKSKEVETWSEAQNARTRAYFEAVPWRTAIRDRLKDLTAKTSPSYFGLQYAGGQVFAMKNQPPKQQPKIVRMPKTGDVTTEAVVVDPNLLDSAGLTAIDWFKVAPDGKLIAVCLSEKGSEVGSIHIFDVATGKRVLEIVPWAQFPTGGGSVAWTADATGFWYTRYPGEAPTEDERQFNQRIYFHKLGTDPKTDKPVLGADWPRIAYAKLDNRFNADATLVTVTNGDGGGYAHYVLRPDGSSTKVAGFEDGVAAAIIGKDGALYMISQKDAPNGKVLKLPLADLTLSKARTIVPESEVSIVTEDWMHSFAVTDGRIYLRQIDGGPITVRMFDLEGKSLGQLPLPAMAAVYELEGIGGDDVLYNVHTYTRPSFFATYAAKTGTSAETGMKVTSPVAFEDAEVSQEFATSKDGTRVGVTVIKRKGTKLDGTNPLILYGYGSYGLSQSPGFLGIWRRLWLDAGGIYAIAHIRGGGEYGHDWAEAGKLTTKQKSFDDFAAAAKHLVAAKYTSPGKLAILGGSAGGLLVGATMTQNPDLFRAVVGQVGFFDVLRTELEPNGVFNTMQFGTVKDPVQFKAMLAYSPLHAVRDGVKYPAVLLTTGANDGRVAPWHSRKMAARLQAATASDFPILLRISGTSGHGQGTALSERIEQQADLLAFLMTELGVSYAAAK